MRFPSFTVSLARMALMGEILAACLALSLAERNTVTAARIAANRIMGRDVPKISSKLKASLTSMLTPFTKITAAASPLATPRGIPAALRNQAS